MLPELESAVLKYAASRTIAVDHTCHGMAGTRRHYWEAAGQNSKDATTLRDAGGNGKGNFNSDGTSRVKGCVIGHCTFVARMESRKHDIEVGPGPAQTYNTKSAIAPLQEFSQHLLPLTQTVQSLFLAFLPEDHEKYTAAYNAIYTKIHSANKRNPVDEAFGIWTSRSLVINANTNNYKDLEDVFHEWCTIVALVDFTGDDACFPQLGVKIDCPPGSIIFLRSYAVEHYIGSYMGSRYSVVHFTHQTVHDAYVEITGKPFWEFEKFQSGGRDRVGIWTCSYLFLLFFILVITLYDWYHTVNYSKLH